MIEKNKLRVGLIVDDGIQGFLNYDLYERSISSSYYSIELLIVQKINPVVKKGKINTVLNYLKRKGIRALFDKIVFSIVGSMDSIIASKIFNFRIREKTYSLAEFNLPKIYIHPIISKSGNIYRYSTTDIGNIKELGLDVLVRGGSGILRGEILSVCKFGIISFHHANNSINRGGPPGFWEVYNREPSTGFIIQRLQDELDGGDVIFKGEIATTFLYTLNVNNIYRKSSIFLHHNIEQLAIDTKYKKIFAKIPYAYTLYRIPTALHSFLYLCKTISYVSKKVIDYVLGKRLRWGIAYQYTDNWKSSVLWRSNLIKNPPNGYLADPFVITHSGQTIIFAEEYEFKSNRGKISAYRIDENGSTKLGVALEENFHLSYPFIFKINGCLYMIPETSEIKEIRIYKCDEFPLKWKFYKTIISGFSATDTCLFKFDEKYWILTNIDSAEIGDNCSELHIFSADSFDSTCWIPHSMNPVIFDAKRARNGGLIIENEDIYRVFQVQGFDMYGAEMGISKITSLTNDLFKEEVICTIPPRFMKGIKGTHTFSYDSGVLCIDFVRTERTRH